MKPFDLLLSRLKGVKHMRALPGERHAVALCPSHDDHHPSCDVRELNDERVLVICGSCGSKEIVEAVGLTLADLYPSNRRYAPAGRKGKGSSAAKPVQAGITRPEVADAAYLIFVSAQALLHGEALTEAARLAIAKIVGRFDPSAITRAAKSN